MLSRVARTILEKAAVDNGFGIDQGTIGDWLIWNATPLRRLASV